jgi:hypothetical protein
VLAILDALQAASDNAENVLATLDALQAAADQAEEGHELRLQCLADERAPRKHHIAVHCQRLPDEEVAARKAAAARVIFLWLRCLRLHGRLARLTPRHLQHLANLARMHHEQECFTRVLHAKAQRKQAVTARA